MPQRISQALFEQLYARGLQLITKSRKNMKNRWTQMMEKVLLRKRALIESVNDQLKNIGQIVRVSVPKANIPVYSFAGA